MVHQRSGAPLKRVDGRLATTPAWTAVEVARTLRRPRALAMLDAALRSGPARSADLACRRRRAEGAAWNRAGARTARRTPTGGPSPRWRARRGSSSSTADCPRPSCSTRSSTGAEISGGLTSPGRRPELVAEYDSMQWHATPEALRHDRMKTARLQECGYRVVPLVVDDVRRRPEHLVERISSHLRAS